VTGGVATLRLSVPADSAYAFAPRIVAAWIVATAGAEIDSVEDARLAVDELVAPFVAAGSGVHVAFAEEVGALAVEIEAARGEVKVELTPIAERILRVVGADFSRLDAGRNGFRLHLRLPGAHENSGNQ
jgi:hypothetical protein